MYCTNVCSILKFFMYFSAFVSETSRSVGVEVAVLSCPYHPDAILMEDYHAGDMICPDCGLIVGDR